MPTFTTTQDTFFSMQMQAMNQFGNRGFGGPPQPQRQGRRGNNRGGFRNSRFDHTQQRNQNQNHGQGGQRPNEVGLNFLSR